MILRFVVISPEQRKTAAYVVRGFNANLSGAIVVSLF